ncbi:MAG: phosphatase PAP2 family protein [Spirochaetes bacterium]|nr:phosphatase PAP2 family protein [Spirochaetota bacterium]
MRRWVDSLGIQNIRVLNAVDALILCFLLLVAILVLLFAKATPLRWVLPCLNLLGCLAIYLLATHVVRSESLVWRQIHAWYGFPLLVIIYKEMYWAVHALRDTLYDTYLIQIDRFLFGTDPTIELAKFAHPVLTEILQTVYVMFYFFPLTIGIALIRKNRYREFQYASFLILYGFFVSYLGYILFPAVGPRFTLHDFYATDRELPGIWLTPYLREFVNRGEGITGTHPNAVDLVQRDVFPSGHTLITLITIYLSFLFKSRTRFILAPLGMVLIFSTVYLRYHYVADLIGAGFLFPLILGSGKYLFTTWELFSHPSSRNLSEQRN